MKGLTLQYLTLVPAQALWSTRCWFVLRYLIFQVFSLWVAGKGSKDLGCPMFDYTGIRTVLIMEHSHDRYFLSHSSADFAMCQDAVSRGKLLASTVAIVGVCLVCSNTSVVGMSQENIYLKVLAEYCMVRA